MNYDIDFKEWLNNIRFSRKVCMLIPMEACMGFPIAVKQGTEYIVPFFKVTSTEKMDTLSPPFAYLRIGYPSATILTYNNLRTLPEWKDIDWNVIAEKNENRTITQKLKKYYTVITNQELLSCFDEQDELLLECLNFQSVDSNQESPLVIWYKKLIAEAKKYR
ncbi:MAG: hypothetical protein IJ002_00940 [Clostridia bacterium]|nr:hypothetical protein [Clostridia bacterium]